MRLIFDTDPGNGFPGADIDDGLALGLILKSPEFELEAITVVGGNTPVERGVMSAFALLEAARVDVPVHAGSPCPLVEDCSPWRAELDGHGREEPAASLWRDIKAPDRRGALADGSAAEAIVRLVDASPGEITIVAVGPLTNVAQAILLDPELPQKVARIAIMGGGFGVRHTLQELNFNYDPEAARIVVASGAKITLVPLDTTLQTFLTHEDNARLTGSVDPLARFLGATTKPWIEYVGRRRGREGCALHDPLAVAVLLDRSFVTADRVRVDVELAGRLSRGRPVSWRPDDQTHKVGLQLHELEPIEVIVEVDNARFVEFLLARLLAS